ncbi:unnamed protein product [Rhizophagus irregularis]|nr:unnamed protein product [Rhizophagus irregularis]
MEIQRIRSALRFGSQVTSEKWKSKEFVQLSGDFRRMEIQRIRSALRFSWLLSSEEQRKIKIRLGCLGFRLSFLGLWIYGFRLSVIGLWIYGFRLSVIELWIGFHFELILNRSGFHFEFLVRFSFGLLLNG